MTSPTGLEPQTLGPSQEAERLWRGAEGEQVRATEDFVALCESLDLGIRAAQILAVLRLEPIRDRLPATIAGLLDRPPAEVDPWRDVVHQPRALRFAEVIDLLSDEELECVTPHLHHGWEDRTWSCRRSRRVAQEAAGLKLERPQRDMLMVLAAYRNRIFDTPPPVRVEPARIAEAFPALRELVEGLKAG
jgi:hypothetical protein